MEHDEDETSKLSEEGEKELSRLWRTWRTVNEMLLDRGYEISNAEVNISRSEFQRRFGDRESGYADRKLMRLNAKPSEAMDRLHTPLPTKAKPEPTTTAGNIWVEFSPETTIGIKHLRQFAQHLDANNTNGIFITMGPVTTAAMRAFEPLTQRGITAEHFQESDLLVNITKHELVPKHVLLSAEEKKTLLARYRLRETQLPRIQQSDPVSKYLGLKRGNVVKIIRKSETAGRYASYRMGKHGKKGGRGRGGSGANNTWRERTNKADVDRHNDQFERYYDELEVVGEDEKQKLWEAMRRDLPNSFRFTGSRAHALAVQQRLKDFYIPEITSITYSGENVQAPKPVDWYPDQLAWYMTTPKHIVRRFPPFASFQKFLVAETDVGNISRQEVVSMIPPLCMDVKPGMTVLDLCAAPGSKSAQLIEMVHAGEEERSKIVAQHFENGLLRPASQDYEDDGRSTGLLIANDVDYRRAHMLIHQMKRLSSPNIIVTNHDATLYPSIKISSTGPNDGKPAANKYLKFDRILADVPCSGDGTCRKNLEIWRSWNAGNALGLHPTQVRILVRAIQMLKVGGRVVYSTCSMNPVEDEAVLAAALGRCGGTEKVEIIDSSNYLPRLRRHVGMRTWKVMDKRGRIWSNYEDVMRQREHEGMDGLGRLQESMFPPEDDVHLERCMRVYPHLQDTGAFFVAILKKKSEIKAKVEGQAKLPQPATVGFESADEPGKTMKLEVSDTDQMATSMHNDTLSATVQRQGQLAKKREQEDDGQASLQRNKVARTDDVEARPVLQGDGIAPSGIPRLDADMLDNLEEVNRMDERAFLPLKAVVDEDAKSGLAPMPDGYKAKKTGQPFEEPFKYLNPDLEELARIRHFYDISPRFPRDRFMVRNGSGSASKNIYYTTALAKSILQENEGKGIKFVHCGVKMFVKQEVPNPDICPWRIQSDGLPIVEAWVGLQRRVKLHRRATLRKLLVEMFPRFNGEEWRNLGEIWDKVKESGMGCCVLEVEPREDEGGLSERMVFPLWKSLHSLNLMLPKEERKALLLRLFNDETPLVNLSQGHAQKRDAKIETQVQPSVTEPGKAQQRRNSSSEEGEGEEEETEKEKKLGTPTT